MIGVTRLYLVRHGETAWNREGRIQGHQNPPLSEEGRVQARSLARRLVTIAFDAAYASDLRRARQTAEIVLEGRGIPLQLLRELRERYLGRWEGFRVDDIVHRDPEAWRVWLTRPRDHAPHGGETEIELERRATGALDRIVKAHPNATVLVVSHGGAIRAALNSWLGEEIHHTPNCGTYVIDASSQETRLVDTIIP